MKTNSKKIAVIITAAGSSTRMGGGIKKEYLPLGDGTVLSTCVKAFLTAANNPNQGFILSHFVITVPSAGVKDAEKAVAMLSDYDRTILEKIKYIEGGATRQLSVFNAMKYLKDKEEKPDFVLIHDGARPFVTQKIIFDVINGVESVGAAIPGIPVTDTIKEISDSGMISRHLLRKSLAAVQTPQGFDFDRLMLSHEQALKDGKEYTDDAEIFGKYSGHVKIVSGDIKNIKITYPGDLERGIAAL